MTDSTTTTAPAPDVGAEIEQVKRRVLGLRAEQRRARRTLDEVRREREVISPDRADQRRLIGEEIRVADQHLREIESDLHGAESQLAALDAKRELPRLERRLELAKEMVAQRGRAIGEVANHLDALHAALVRLDKSTAALQGLDSFQAPTGIGAAAEAISRPFHILSTVPRLRVPLSSALAGTSYTRLLPRRPITRVGASDFAEVEATVHRNFIALIEREVTEARRRAGGTS